MNRSTVAPGFVAYEPTDIRRFALAPHTSQAMAPYTPVSTDRDRQLLTRDMLRFYDRVVKTMQDAEGNDQFAPLAGSLYRFLAWKDYGYASGLFRQSRHLDRRSPFFSKGLLLVVVIQMLGPPCLALYCFITMFSADRFVDLNPSTLLRAIVENFHFLKLLRIVMGVLLLLLFCLNGLYVLDSDTKVNKRIIHLSQIFSAAAVRNGLPLPDMRWLFIGSIVNSWCLIGCACCMWPSFIISDQSVKDILFDALALTFLYNLDDVAGDLSFLEDQWDADMLGDMYGKMSEEPDLVDSLKEVRESFFTPDNIDMWASRIMAVLTWVLPVAFVVSVLLVKI